MRPEDEGVTIICWTQRPTLIFQKYVSLTFILFYVTKLELLVLKGSRMMEQQYFYFAKQIVLNELFNIILFLIHYKYDHSTRQIFKILSF